MLACLDVDYRDRDTWAVAACLLFEDWRDEAPVDSVTAVARRIESYTPGEFYRRELPCLLAVLAGVPVQPRMVVIDGFVWLNDKRPGLGAHLHEALEGAIPIVGVAKNPYSGADSVPVVRGESQHPLHVSAVGVDAEQAARDIASMHGSFRIPTLLKQVDRLARDAHSDGAP